MKRQKAVLGRQESSEEEALTSLREAQWIRQELGDELRGNAEFERLETEWTRKRQTLESLLRMGNDLKQVLAIANTPGIEEVWPELGARLEELDAVLSAVPEAEQLPLHWLLAQRVQLAQQQLRRQLSERQRQHRDELKKKLDALRLTPEADLGPALRVLEVGNGRKS